MVIFNGYVRHYQRVTTQGVLVQVEFFLGFLQFLFGHDASKGALELCTLPFLKFGSSLQTMSKLLFTHVELYTYS